MTWTIQTPTSSSWNSESYLTTIELGTPIGLLLALTYSETFTTGDSWTLQNPNSESWVLATPNSGGFSIDNPTSTTWN